MHSRSDITFLLQTLSVYFCLQGKVQTSQLGRQCLSPSGLNRLSNLSLPLLDPLFWNRSCTFMSPWSFLCLEFLPPLSYWMPIYLLRPSWFYPLLVKPVKTFLTIPWHNYFLSLCAHTQHLMHSLFLLIRELKCNSLLVSPPRLLTPLREGLCLIYFSISRACLKHSWYLLLFDEWVNGWLKSNPSFPSH